MELRHIHAVHGHLEETGVDGSCEGVVGSSCVVVGVVVVVGEVHRHGHRVCLLEV